MGKMLNEENIYFANRIEMLKGRVKRCKCKYCGGDLRLKKIIFVDYDEARIEIFCGRCNRIEYGVESEIYESAKYFVEKSKFNCFPDLDDNENTKRMIIAKVCEIMAWENQYIGVLDENGFSIPISSTKKHMGECITFSESEIANE